MKYLIFIFLFIGCSCANQQIPVVETIVKPAQGLSWNMPSWDVFMKDAVNQHYENLSQATDFKVVCPNSDPFAKIEWIDAFSEFMVQVAFFESTWNPKNRYFETTMGYYSEGLFQMSVVDESWVKCGFTKESIVDPEVNTRCAVKTLGKQIAKHKKIFISKGVYWAVIKDGGKYSRIESIKTRLAKAYPKCAI